MGEWRGHYFFIIIIIIIEVYLFIVCFSLVQVTKAYYLPSTTHNLRSSLVHTNYSRSALTIYGHDLRSRFALTIYAGHGLRSRSALTVCDRVTVCAHDRRSRSAITVCDHDLRSRSAITIYGHDLRFRSALTISVTVSAACALDLYSSALVWNNDIIRKPARL